MEKINRFLRAGALLLLFIGCVFSGGCGRVTPKYHYELSDELKLSISNADEVIEILRNALRDHNYSITIQYRAGDGYMDEVEFLASELMKYAMEETDNPKEGDYIRYQCGGYTLDYGHEETGDDFEYYMTIYPKYYTDSEEEEAVDERISEILGGLAFSDETADYEKISAIYDFVCSNVSYDTIHKSSLYHLKSTAYAALERKTAGCQGYSVLLYRLLREAGINCRVVTGNAEHEGETELHAWNLVQLGNVWYYLDATWDSEDGGREYFLRGSSGLTDHVPDENHSGEDWEKKYDISGEDYFFD